MLVYSEETSRVTSRVSGLKSEGMSLSIAFFMLCTLVTKWPSAEGLFPGIENCKNAEPLDRESFSISYTVTSVDKSPSLTYEFTWDPPGEDSGILYGLILIFERRGAGLEDLIYTDCEYIARRSAELREDEFDLSGDPHFEAENVKFTQRGLLQVAYGITSSIPYAISTALNIHFETPDCYATTGDAAFCATQDVVRCGQPINVRLRYLTVDNDAITLRLQWEAPAQINGMAVVYDYLAELNSTEGSSFLTERFPARNGILTWDIGGVIGSGPIELGQSYTLFVTPYIYYTDEPSPSYVPGRAATYEFLAEIHEPTPDHTTTLSSLKEPIAGTNPKTPPENGVIGPILIISLVAVVLLTLVCIGIVLRKKRRGNRRLTGRFKNLDRVRMSMKEPEKKKEVAPLLRAKEISHDQVTIVRKIGEGNFGIVHKGSVRGVKGIKEDLPVAIKTTRVGAAPEIKEDLLNEMKLLTELGDHANILCLIACCSTIEPFYLITEFMQYGDLRSFLRKCREKRDDQDDPVYNVDELKQIIFARDIAMGMAHIQERRFYHGDLAARNILVGDRLSIKVSDFGLADDVYTRGYKRRDQEQKIPIKWCSLETVLNGICSSEGDVWSFGVLLYEVFTLGGSPYPGVTPRYLVSLLKQGYRMEQPSSCPNDIYELMVTCWDDEPRRRPRFKKIAEDLAAMLLTRTDYVEVVGDSYDVGGEVEKRAAAQEGDHVTEMAPINDEYNEINIAQLQDALNFEGDV